MTYEPDWREIIRKKLDIDQAEEGSGAYDHVAFRRAQREYYAERYRIAPDEPEPPIPST